MALAGPPIRTVFMEVRTILLGAALLGLIVFLMWWTAASGDAPFGSTATITAIGPAEHLPAESPRRPAARVSLRLDGGGSWTTTAEPAQVGRCRIGDRVSIIGTRMNSGGNKWKLAGGACVRR